MQEICFCGRVGEVENREPVSLENGARALECPECGDIDLVIWLPAEARNDIFEEAAKRYARRLSPTAA